MLACFALACERTPESLEDWRNAEGGYEKLAEWATSSEEPEAVRIRAVQILIEENQADMLVPLMEKVESDEMRAKLVQGAVPTIEKMWAKADWPKIDPNDAKGGMVKVEGKLESVVAKDAAYFLQPFAQGESKEKLENILATWMSQDQDVRNQLGSTTLAQVAPRAGKKGVEMMLKWLETTKQPAVVVDKIVAANTEDKNEEVTAALAAAVAKRAEAEHPKLSEQTRLALLKLTHENLAPYLERAINDPESPADLIDAAMEVYARSMGDRATPFFAKLVAEKDGLLRWVAATRLIETRGKSGVLVAAKALPLETESYSKPKDDSFKTESEIFCNFVDTELKEQGLETAEDVVKNLIESERWPARVLGIRCAGVTKEKSAVPMLEALKKDKTQIPGWGGKKTVAELAKETAAELEKG